MSTITTMTTTTGMIIITIMTITIMNRSSARSRVVDPVEMFLLNGDLAVPEGSCRLEQPVERLAHVVGRRSAVGRCKVALDVIWAGVVGVIAIALGMAITLAAIGMASMVAHRLIIGDGRSQEIGRFTTIAASLIVIATAGTLLLGSLDRFFR